MKRATLIVLGALVLGAVALVGTTFADRDDWGPGRGWGRGPGMMGGGGYGYGMGPGMMGGGEFGYGMGPGMMWGEGAWDLDDYAQVPADKRAKLRELAVETQRKMVGQMSAMHELMLVQRDSLAKFPVDKGAASKAWEGLNAMHKQMFETRLDAVAKAQDILGKELWDKVHADGFRRGPRG